MTIVLALTYLGAFIALGWLALQSRQGRLARNYIAGYRTATIMRSDESWRVAHYAAWKWTLASAVVCLISALAGLFVSTYPQLLILNLVVLLALTVTICVGAYIAQQAAKSVP